MSDYSGPPGLVLTRDMWNYSIINNLNSTTPGVYGDGLPLLPSTQTWIRQADISAARSFISGHWPHHYFRYTSNPVGKMTAFNDLYDAANANRLWNLPTEFGSEYIVYCRKWRERTGAVFDHFNMIAAGRAVEPPIAPEWWIAVYPVHTFTMMYHWIDGNAWFLADADTFSYDIPWLYEAMHNYSWYDRTFYIPMGGSEPEEIEDVDYVDDRIPTIVTASDGSRSFISPATGGQCVLPAAASEPRTYFIVRVMGFT